jgi:hypothetical protein
MKAKLRISALFLMLTGAARAGVTMTQTMQELDGQKPASTNVIHLDKDKVRIDMGQKPGTYMIYRGDKKVFWNVDAGAKSYMEMTEKDFSDMSAKMEEAKKKMEAQMQNMPPEQKKMMEEMMAKMAGGGAKAPKTAYKKVGGGGKVGPWSTEKYEGTREGAKVSEVWTTAPKAIGIQEADMQVLKDMAKSFEKFAKNFSGMIGDKENGLEGVPVKTIAYTDGKARWQTEIKEVKKESIDPALFEIPAGFTAKKMGQPQ